MRLNWPKLASLAQKTCHFNSRNRYIGIDYNSNPYILQRDWCPVKQTGSHKKLSPKGCKVFLLE